MKANRDRRNMTDLILTNGLLYDGSGNSPYYSSIGITGNRIEWIGQEPSLSAIHSIDLNGLAVSPGFIDSHTHAEGYIVDNANPFLGKLMQGVTTEIFGNCGLSIFPNEPGCEQELRDYFGPFSGSYRMNWNWRGLQSLEEEIGRDKLISNVGTLVGHGSLRIAAMGFADRKPDAKELATMVSLLNTAFDEGAVGLSLGLMYPPGLYADLDELVTLAKVAAKRKRLVTSHIRNESFHLLDSVEEMIQIASRSGARVVVSHHKAVGKKNWGKISRSLLMIDEANAKGMDILIDVYPYTAGNTMLRALLPPWALDGGVKQMIARLNEKTNRDNIRSWILERKDWENLSLAGGWESIMILSTKVNHEYEGRYLDDLASATGKMPVEFLMDLLIEEEGQAVILLFTACEEDLIKAMKKPYCMIVSDGIPATGHTHPRLHGTFPRFLSNYVIKQNVMPLEEGIRRITSLPAKTYGLKDRGVLRKDAFADIVVFDPAQLSDRATYKEPDLMPVGIKYVFLNGQMAISQGILESGRFGSFV